MLDQVQHQPEGVKFLRAFVEGTLISPLLLVGDEGVGRRYSVMQAIQEVFCTGTKKVGCDCYSCLILPQGLHPDFKMIYAAEKDIGIDAVRDIVQEAKDYPSSAPVRCFVIDGVDRFTPPAANAFLKTLEEPPANSRFFLLSEFNEQVLPTIRSRCGSLHYSTLPEPFVVSVLHQYESDDAKALVYARMGEGSVGRAVRYWGSGQVRLRDQVFKALQLALDRDLPAFFSSVDGMDKDLALALNFMEHLLHDVLIVCVDPMRVINADRAEDVLTISKRAPAVVWSRLARKVRDLRNQYRSTRLNLHFHVKTIFVESLV